MGRLVLDDVELPINRLAIADEPGGASHEARVGGRAADVGVVGRRGAAGSGEEAGWRWSSASAPRWRWRPRRVRRDSACLLPRAQAAGRLRAVTRGRLGPT